MRTRPTTTTPDLTVTVDPLPGTRPRLRPAEALWLGGVALVMAVAWAALLTAHLGVLSAATVVPVAVTMLAPLAVLWWRGRRPLVAGPWAEVAGLAVAAVLLAWLYLPGYPYGVADKDPGVYMTHGFAIAATGSVAQHDEVTARFPGVATVDEATRFPGIYVRDAARAEVVPQFYHLWPALLGLAGRVAGQTAMVNLNPLLAVLSVLGVYLLGRRISGPILGAGTGPVAGTVAAGVLGTGMIQVWQARYPSTEISTQLWIVLGLLAVAIAIQERWTVAAALGGAALGVAWLDRADGLLPVLLALGVLAVCVVTGRAGRGHAAFAAGLGVVLPHAVWQALVPAARYSRVAAGVTPPVLALLFGGLALGTAIGWLLWRAGLGKRLTESGARLARPGLKVLLPAGLALLALVAWFRPQLFGVDYFLYDDRVIRSYDEINLRRLSWFLTVPGVLAALAGFAVVSLRRWRASAWAVIGPALVLLCLYVYVAENSARLMWWSRRYVPVGLVVIALLVGIAVAAAVAWARTARRPLPLLAGAAGLGVAVLMVVTGLSQSLPLRSHREWGGSFEVTARIAALGTGAPALGTGTARPDARAVFALVQTSPPDTSVLFGAPLWFQRGQLSVLLPAEPGPADLAAVRRAFPDRPLLVVGDARRGLPPGLRDAGLTQVGAVPASMPFWEQATEHRPDHPGSIDVNVGVWRAP
jgi:hypothetical protein